MTTVGVREDEELLAPDPLLPDPLPDDPEPDELDEPDPPEPGLPPPDEPPPGFDRLLMRSFPSGSTPPTGCCWQDSSGTVRSSRRR
jgi:hypothetical protein